MLEIVNLRKAYGSHLVLHDVSLRLLPGTIHGLVGANGAGKTTLLNCLYGLETGYSGTVRAGAGRAVRELTGYLPYEPYFYPRLTGREYLEFCLQARGQRVPDFAEWQQLLELPLDQYANEYSAGMRKKLALLALLVQQFDFLILDEPFQRPRPGSQPPAEGNCCGGCATGARAFCSPRIFSVHSPKLPMKFRCSSAAACSATTPLLNLASLKTICSTAFIEKNWGCWLGWCSADL